MRVAQIAGLAGPGPIAGGVWRVALSQTQELRAAGHDVELHSLWLGHLPPRVIEDTPVDLSRARQLVPGGELRGLFSPSGICRARRAIRESDVAHIHIARDMYTVPTLLSARGHPVVVAQPHGMLTASRHKRYDALLLAPALGRVSKFAVLTDAEASSLQGQLGVDRDRIVRVQNAVREVLGVERVASTTVRYLFVGRLHERKRPIVYVEAAAELLRSGRDVEFGIVGPDAGELNAVLQLLSDLGSSERGARISYLGTLENASLRRTLATYDVLVLPSTDEPYPISVLEACSASLAVVVTDTCGLADTIQSGGGGLVIPPTKRALVGAMAALADNLARLRTMQRLAHATYRQHWQPAALQARLLDIYRSAAAS